MKLIKNIFFTACMLLTQIAWSVNGYIVQGSSLKILENRSSLKILDSQKDEITGTVGSPLDSQWYPVAIAFSPDNHRVYVVNQNSIPNDDGFRINNIRVIDTVSNTEIGEVRTRGFEPKLIAISPNGDFGYIVETNRISILDTNTSKITGRVTGFFDQYGEAKKIIFTPDGKKALVLGGSYVGVNKSTFIIDTMMHAVTKIINYYDDVVCAPKNNVAYFAFQNQITILDLNSGQVLELITLPNYIHHLAITPNGNKIYATTSSDDKAYVVDTTNNAVKEIMLQTHRANYDKIAISSDGEKGYLASVKGITVVDIKTDKEVKMILLGSNGSFDIDDMKFPN